jgi:hypothetical protein
MTPTQEEQASAIERAIAQTIGELSCDGAPWPLILSVLHAVVVTEIATCYGGAVAAERCRSAARRVESLQMHPAHELAQARPAGSA